MTVLAAGSLTKASHTFGGWCTTQPAPGSACTGAARAAASTFAISSDVTLYAVWYATPAAPTALTGTPSGNQVALTWTAPTNDGGSAVTDYTIQYRASTNATWTTLNDGVSSATGATVGSLTAATSYLFRVAALNVAGTGSYTSETFACTQTCPYDDSYTATAGAGATSSGAVIYSVAVQPDGGIVHGGSFTAWSGATVANIVRLSGNGTYDASFTTNVGSGPNGTISEIAVQSDGKILVGGSFTTWGGTTVNRIVRLNSDGTRDTAFTTNAGLAANNSVGALAIQSDGKILVGGSFTTWGGTTVNRIVRLNSDGTRDTAFTTSAGTASNGRIDALGLQSTGKIIVGGVFTSWDGTTVGGLVRLETTGARDTVFTTTTGTGADVGGANSIRTLAVDSTDRILAGGQFNLWNGAAVKNIVRLGSDGTHDTTFTTNIGSGPGGGLFAIVVLSNSKIVVGGGFVLWNGTPQSNRVQLNDAGTRDTGYATTGANEINSTVQAIVAQPNGKTIIAGDFTTYGGTSGVPLGRHIRIN